MEVNTTLVHAAHCCGVHGCKYSDEECGVAAGTLEQEHPCEFCDTAPVVAQIVSWLEKRITAQQEQAERALRDGDANAHHRRVVKVVVLADVVRGLREGVWKS